MTEKKTAPVPAKKFGDVYRHIYFNKVSSRQELARELGISLPTLSLNLGLLQEMGLVCTAGEFESTGGRKANMITFIPEAKYALGVDITRLHTVFILTDLSLHTVDLYRLNEEYEDSPAYYRSLNSIITDMLKKNNISAEQFLGVGISVPATIEPVSRHLPDNTIIGLPVSFSDILKDYIQYPFHLINDADAAGWAELWHQETDRTMIYLSLNYTVGGAILHQRHVFQGDQQRSAEFGHMTLFPHGKKCYCGKKGCVDAYCAEKVLSDFTGGDVRQFFDELKAGNLGFREIFNQYMDNLCIVINNLKMCFDSSVVLGGTMGHYLKDYLDEIRSKACQLSTYKENTEYITVCSLNEEPSAVGAALYYVDRFISSL